MDAGRMIILIAFLLVISIFSLLFPVAIPASARGVAVISDLSHQSGRLGEYKALIIGINEYEDPEISDLTTAVNDARAMAGLLRERYGFSVTKLLLDQAATRRAIFHELRKLVSSTKPDDSVLIYYAGHGNLDNLTNDGWWIPADAEGGDPVTYLDNIMVQKYVRNMKARHVLVISDSCYSGTLFGTARDMPPVIDDKYYLNLYNEKSRWGMTSGNKTPVADEGTGGHSVFAYQLLKELRKSEKPYISTQELYTRIALIVSNNSEQTPICRPIRNIGDQGGEFIFVASSRPVEEEQPPGPSKSYLSLESNVSGARVLVDGREVGLTNLADIEILPGEHLIEVEKEGYESESRKVRFVEGRVASLYVDLRWIGPSKGKLYVDTEPKGARVRVLNIKPKYLRGMALDPGRYFIEVSAEGYQTLLQWVEIVAGHQKPFRFKLVKTTPAAPPEPIRSNILRFASRGSLESLDPYNRYKKFHLGTLGNVYEGLTRRKPDLEIEPALAESWKVMEPTRWRFYLRRGVRFHDGTPFTADDVVFSATRVRHRDSKLRDRLADVTKVIKVDNYTVDIVTKKPNPILPANCDIWYIMSKSWADRHNSVLPQAAANENDIYTSRHTNGTGPFMLVSHERGGKTLFKANPDWWDNKNKEHNLTDVIFTPIQNDSTRVAALLDGEVDMAYPIPAQDIDRVERNSYTRMLIGPDLRTIFLGMDQSRDELLYSDVRGGNPFKDKRVRQAVYQAIDIEAIHSKVMHGLSKPSAMMIAPSVRGGGNPKFKRREYDPAVSKMLLAEAGYLKGFEVGLDCPNDRYVFDEQICLAVTSMLGEVGIRVNLMTQPHVRLFDKILAPKLDTSFYLLGWIPGNVDSYSPLYNLHACPKKTGQGKYNLGGYCSPEVDRLIAKIGHEMGLYRRDMLIEQAWMITIDDIAYIPLHQQTLAWGVSRKVDLKQRPDNLFAWRHVVLR